MESNNKSYYAIIPASVRYDDSLTANAKLLYGEISALCNEKGYCWATNEYFSILYKVSEVSISKWIRSLSESGYIKLKYERRGFEVTQRNIYLIDGLTKVNLSVKQNANPSDKENLKDNITLNNKSNNTVNDDKSSLTNKNYNKEIISYYSDLYKAHYNIEPLINYGAVGKMVKILLATNPPEIIKKKLDRYFKNDLWFNKNSNDFNYFYRHYNDVVIEAEKPKPMSQLEMLKKGIEF